MKILQRGTFDKLIFGEPRDNISGGKTVGVFDARKEKLTFKIRNTCSKNGFQGGVKKWVELFVHDTDIIQSIETLVLDEAQRKSLSWFGKNINETKINQMFKTSCTNDFVKTHVPVDPMTNKFIASFFNAKPSRIDPESLDINNKRLDVIVQLTGIYFIPGNFGLSWKLIQMLVHPQYTFSDCAFELDEDDESDAEPI